MQPLEFGVPTRKATADDVPFLMELRRATMRPHLTAAGIDQDDDAMRERVLTEFESALIVERDVTPIGLLKLTKSGQMWTLHQLQLLPEWQGMGIGTGVLRNILAQAAQCGSQVELHVLKVNQARRLYERLGFIIVAEGIHAFTMRADA
jgi:ribosomal protein S18 acetylase RimI-like enzyme